MNLRTTCGSGGCPTPPRRDLVRRIVQHRANQQHPYPLTAQKLAGQGLGDDDLVMILAKLDGRHPVRTPHLAEQIQRRRGKVRTSSARAAQGAPIRVPGLRDQLAALRERRASR